MDKIARSSDPQQQALRDHKKRFNAAAKEFVKRLIAVKKGINGRGDNSYGIPVSRIQDPLPHEVMDMLHEVSSNFAQLAEEALQISNEQAFYSEHRRQPQPEAPEGAAAPASPEAPPAEVPKAAAIHSLLTKLAQTLGHKWKPNE